MHDAGYTVIESELEQIFHSIDANQQGHIGMHFQQLLFQATKRLFGHLGRGAYTRLVYTCIHTYFYIH